MADETLSQLRKEVARLRALVEKAGAAVVPASDDPKDRSDYVERGSDRHAAMLGLKKAENGTEFQVDGWMLEDVTQFGPNVTKEYIMAWLRQRVNELTSSIPPVQSADPLKPNFAPVMWQTNNPLSKITE